jgi:hypothetical protein
MSTNIVYILIQRQRTFSTLPAVKKWVLVPSLLQEKTLDITPDKYTRRYVERLENSEAR